MIDISEKITTLREAISQAIISVSPNTIQLIKENKVPKGNIFEVSKTVGLLAAKQTPFLLPFCHNIPISNIDIDISIQEDQIIVTSKIVSISSTGVEMESLVSASLAALNIYDMLKPIDKNIIIKEIKLLSKKGGKSDFTEKHYNIKAAILVVSDSIYEGKKEDKSGKIITDFLKHKNFELYDYQIVPDEKEKIKQKINEWINKTDIIFITGGTGISKRDYTPEAVKEIIDREIPGIAEFIRNYGFQRTPYSMLSRSISGIKDQTLIITLPGSSRGVKESLTAIIDYLPHAVKVSKINSGGHNDNT